MSISASSPVKERRLATLDPDNIDHLPFSEVQYTDLPRPGQTGTFSSKAHKGHWSFSLVKCRAEIEATLEV